ncbi:MAG TPA: ATPase, partial [Deltaproteobacteria bacterium]|nr:ATPase [Deltaproteobacteria bacterium]
HGDDARRFARHNGFPFILKPRDGAGASGTVKVTDGASLERAIAQRHLDNGGAYWTAEDFIDGHEGFYDTLSVGGQVVFEAISHYYPRVLTAMRNRFPNPYLVTTNRLDSPGYEELRRLGRGAIQALGIGTAATHMEWFAGDKGLVFNEIGARPPGVNVFDLHGHASQFDIYRAWAEAICFGKIQTLPQNRGCGGLVSLRPERDGTVVRVHGIDAMQRKYGRHIYSARIPAPGTRTQPVEAGYRANGYIYAVHEDYDACKAMMAELGRSIAIEVR